MLVDRHEQELRTSNRIVRDDTLETRLEEITCAIVGSLCEQLRVYVIRVPGFNAFMLPNGAMFIQTGLLLRIGDDSELATVVAHEASHFARKHSVERIRRWHRTASGLAIVNGLLSAAGTVATVAANSYEAAAQARNLSDTALGMLEAAGVIAVYQLVAYSREQEREADLDGLNWMIAHGIDPRGAPRIWQKIVDEQKAGGRHSGFSLLATNPTPRARLNYLSEAIEIRGSTEDYKIADPSSQEESATTLLSLVDPYRREWIVDEMEAQHPGQFEAIARAQEGFQVPVGFTSYLIGKAWASHARELRGRQQKRAIGAAASAFERGASAEPSMQPEGFRDWARVSLQRGDTESAKENFLRYLSLVPTAWDADYVRREVEGL